MVRLRQVQLPSPSLNITLEKQLEQSVSKILEGLSDFEQVVLMKYRWEEVKKLQVQIRSFLR